MRKFLLAVCLFSSGGCFKVDLDEVNNAWQDLCSREKNQNRAMCAEFSMEAVEEYCAKNPDTNLCLIFTTQEGSAAQSTGSSCGNNSTSQGDNGGGTGGGDGEGESESESEDTTVETDTGDVTPGVPRNLVMVGRWDSPENIDPSRTFRFDESEMWCRITMGVDGERFMVRTRTSSTQDAMFTFLYHGTIEPDVEYTTNAGNEDTSFLTAGWLVNENNTSQSLYANTVPMDLRSLVLTVRENDYFAGNFEFHGACGEDEEPYCMGIVLGSFSCQTEIVDER